MNRGILILLAGLICGVAAHLGWYEIRRVPPADDLEAQLAWMQRDLGLSDEQLIAIKAVHEQSARRLMALASQVAGMQGEWQAFEQQRQTRGQVDFLEFARFVEQRRELNEACLISTETLVQATANVLTPEQRQKYYSLLRPTLPAVASWSNERG